MARAICRPPGSLRVFTGQRELPAETRGVEHSTCLRLRVRLPGEGVHRLRVREAGGQLEATANPVLCRSGGREGGTYWGMIHGHTEMSDGAGTLDGYFHRLRREAGLDFAATGDHDHLWETSGRLWRQTQNKVREWHDPGRFVTLLGYEWAKWRRNGDGDRNVYYRRDDRPLYRSDYGHFPRPPDLFGALAGEEALVIPHHTAHAGNFCDFKDHDPELERLVEIYQLRGSYECAEEDGNPRPETCDGEPVPEGYVQRALRLGWRVGFTGGGDDHQGTAGTGRGDGLMAVLARERTREAIWEAMRSRRVVATTGPRILLHYRLEGMPMGSELDAGEVPGLRRRRSLLVRVHGTAPLQRVEVIRNNELARRWEPGVPDFQEAWPDEEPLEKVLLPGAKFCDHPFCFYYVRVVQEDGAAAWASPVWIELPG